MTNRSRWKNTIIEYVREWGKYSFEEREFTQVDSLVLCQLSYLKYDHLVPGLYENREPIPFKKVMTNPARNCLFEDERFREKNKALVLGVLKSKRFQDLKLNYYVNVVEQELQTQFSAVTFYLDTKVYIAFRGTDELLVGWREDFYFALSTPVPAQRFSVDYLNNVMDRITGSMSKISNRNTDADFKSDSGMNGKLFIHREPVIYVGGHSKGGNLAMYACIFCDGHRRDVIDRVFCHDGPGIPKRIKETNKSAYRKVLSKMEKTIPYASVVGMLFQEAEQCTVVKSNRIGLGQHDPFSWIIEDGQFVLEKNVKNRTQVFDDALNAWINDLSEEQIHMVVDTIFDILEQAECENLIDMQHEWKRDLRKIKEAAQGLNPEVKEQVKKILKKLLTY